MGYRQDYLKAYPPKRGKYRCASCKKKFKTEDITIDHKIPMRMGGTDRLSNLQPMCRSCNSSKNARVGKGEMAGYMVNSAFHGDLGKTFGGMANQKLKDFFCIKYKRRH